MHPCTKKCIDKCFSLTHPRFYRGDENQKLLMDNECWDKIVQTGSLFVFNMVENSISGVGWQVSSREDATKEFQNGKR
jgi:hypothetical protein